MNKITKLSILWNIFFVITILVFIFSITLANYTISATLAGAILIPLFILFGISFNSAMYNTLKIIIKLEENN